MALHSPMPATAWHGAFDAARSTGWALYEGPTLRAHGEIDHGVGTNHARHAFARFARAVEVLAGNELAACTIEAPYIPDSAGDRGKAATGIAKASAQVSRRVGFLEGTTWLCWPEAEIWSPNATSWRALLGLNRWRADRPGGKKRPPRREEVIADCVAHAVAVVIAAGTRPGEYPLQRHGRENGATLTDEAMAVCIGRAGWHHFHTGRLARRRER